MFCPQCGATNEPDQRFCYNCGARLETTQPQPYAENAPLVTADPPSEPPIAASWDQQLPPAPSTPPPYPAYTPSYTTATIPNSTNAIISLILGIVAWVILPVIAAIGAVIFGHMARNEIRNSGGQIGGAGMATVGLVLGYIQIGLVVLACSGFMFLVIIGVAFG